MLQGCNSTRQTLWYKSKAVTPRTPINYSHKSHLTRKTRRSLKHKGRKDVAIKTNAKQSTAEKDRKTD